MQNRLAICLLLTTFIASGLQDKTIEKTSLPASDSNEDTLIMNLGSVGTMMIKPICCVGSNCSEVPPPLPPIHSVPNGKTCPTCYPVHSSECKEEIAPCAGNDIYCFEIAVKATAGEMTVTTLMKGCSNAAVCNETSQSSGSFGGISIVASFQCTRASGTASSNPGFIRLFFQAWAGILVVRILS